MTMRSQIPAFAIVAVFAGSILSAQSGLQKEPGHAPAKTKVYRFRSVDYPGCNYSQVGDYEGGLVVGTTFQPYNPAIGFIYHGTKYKRSLSRVESRQMGSMLPASSRASIWMPTGRNMVFFTIARLMRPSIPPAQLEPLCYGINKAA